MARSVPVNKLLDVVDEDKNKPPHISIPLSINAPLRIVNPETTIVEEYSHSEDDFEEVDLNEPGTSTSPGSLSSTFVRRRRSLYEFREAEVQTDISLFDEDGPLAPNKEDVTNQIETLDLIITLEPRSRFLSWIFHIAYYTGFSTVNGNGDKKFALQRVIFVILAIFSLFDALANIKTYMLDDFKGGIVLHYVRVVLQANSFLVRVVFLKIMQSIDIAEYLKLNSTNYKRIPKSEHETVSKPAFAFFVIDAIVAVVVSLDVYLIVIHGWSKQNIFRWQSVHVSRMLFQWHRSNGTETLDYLWDTYGTEFTPASVIMGIFGASYRISGFLEKCFVLDILLGLSYHLLCIVLQYQVILNDTQANINKIVIKKMWKAYFHVYLECVRINHVFSFLVNLTHVDNLFFLATALLGFVNDDLDRFDFFEFSWRILKIIITYSANVAITYMTENFKYWINIEAERAEDLDEENQALKLELIRINQRIQVTPIGLGNGTYRVTESFMNRFLGIVVSLFMLFAKPS